MCSSDHILLKKLSGATEISDDFESRLSKFLNERNWLIHRSRREKHTVLYNPAKLRSLCNRIDAIAVEALDLNKLFCEYVLSWTESQGIKRQQIDEVANLIVKYWQKTNGYLSMPYCHTSTS